MLSDNPSSHPVEELKKNMEKLQEIARDLKALELKIAKDLQEIRAKVGRVIGPQEEGTALDEPQ